MIKREAKMIMVCILALSLSIGGFVANAATSKKSKNAICQHTGKKGSVYNVLKNNLGITDEEIENARNSGKTAYDLAKEKGVAQDKLKSMVLEERLKIIDEAVSKGEITKEKAVVIKAAIKTKMQNWDGSLKHKEGKRGMHNPVNSTLKNKLGFTDSKGKSTKEKAQTKKSKLQAKRNTWDGSLEIKRNKK